MRRLLAALALALSLLAAPSLPSKLRGRSSTIGSMGVSEKRSRSKCSAFSEPPAKAVHRRLAALTDEIPNLF